MTRLLVALACLSLGISGCSDSASPSDPPPQRAPSSPTSAPTSEPTEDRETPEEFVRRWVEAANQLGRDGDPAPLLRASHRCADCEAIATGVAKIYKAGGWIRGSDWTVSGPVEVVQVRKGIICTLHLSIAPGEYKANEHTNARRTPGGNAKIKATLIESAGQFKMRAFVRLAQ